MNPIHPPEFAHNAPFSAYSPDLHAGETPSPDRLSQILSLPESEKEHLPSAKIREWIADPALQEKEKLSRLEAIIALSDTIQHPANDFLYYLFWCNRDVVDFFSSTHVLPPLEGYQQGMAVGIAAIESLGIAATGLGILWKFLLLEQADKAYKLHKERDATDPSLVRWAEWIQKEKAHLQEESIRYGIPSSALTANRAIEIMNLFVPVSPVVQGMLAIISSGVTVGLGSWSLYDIQTKEKRQKEWIESLRPPPIPEKRELILEKRKTSLEERMQAFSSVYEKEILQSDFSTDTRSCKEILDDLRKKGLFLQNIAEKTIESRDDLLEWIEHIRKTPSLQKQLQQSWAEHHETVALLTQNGLRTLAAHKNDIEGKTVHRKKIKAQISLGAAGISLTLTTLLEILALTGVIALPTLALGITGVGLFALALLFLALGMIYLYKEKPHVFRAHFRGTFLLKQLHTIPYQWTNWRQRTTLLKILATIQSEKQEDEKRIKQLLKTYRSRRHTYCKWATRVQKYRAIIVEAEWHDFLASHPTYRGTNPAAILAKGLENPPHVSQIQRALYAFFARYFGANKEGLPSSSLAQAQLQAFCSMDNADLLSFIQNQLAAR